MTKEIKIYKKGLIKEAILISVAIFFLVEIGLVSSNASDGSLAQHLKQIGDWILDFINNLR